MSNGEGVMGGIGLRGEDKTKWLIGRWIDGDEETNCLRAGEEKTIGFDPVNFLKDRWPSSFELRSDGKDRCTSFPLTTQYVNLGPRGLKQ